MTNMNSSISESFKTNPIDLSHIIPLDFESVHGLPDSHVWTHTKEVEVPVSKSICNMKSDSTPYNTPSLVCVPVIDLFDSNAASLVRRACEKWGVFQVTNHGIPMHLMKEAEFQTRRLFALPRDQKLRALRSPEGLTGYGLARISKNFPKLMWSEGFTIMGSPAEHALQLWPRHHANFCDAMEEYQKAMKGLALKLIGLMLGSLGLNYEDVKWLKPKNSSRPQTLLQLNSYPVCPDPTRAMGLAPHTDSSLLTLLNQSSISGLQVLVDAIRWVPVHPIPGALVVNVGDLMHILSNGQFKSVAHRAVVNEVHHRISMAYFYGPPMDVKISPLIDHNHPLYQPVTWKEYLEYKATHFDKALEVIRTDAQKLYQRTSDDFSLGQWPDCTHSYGMASLES